jgi:hypothetical protein
MACQATAAECLHDHIRPHLSHPRSAADDKSYRALCPVHDDHEHSLSVSLGTKGQRIVCRCFAGCEPGRVRARLITAGIRAACLPRSAAEQKDSDEQILALLTSDLGHAEVRLRIAAILVADGQLPRGAALDEFAASFRVSRRSAYDALRTPNR